MLRIIRDSITNASHVSHSLTLQLILTHTIAFQLILAKQALQQAKAVVTQWQHV